MKNGKKTILLVSKFSIDSSVYTYASSFVSALQSLGYEVIIFNTKKNYVQCGARSHDDLSPLLKWLNNKVVNWLLKREVKRINPDIVFFIKAENIAWKTMVSIKQMSNAQVINFYPDNPFSFWNGNSNQDVLLALPCYDLFLIWESSLIPQLQAAGCKRVAYFPFAYDEQIFNGSVRVDLAAKKSQACDVCFVGTWDAEREWWLNAIKQNLPELNLGIWGNGWEKTIAKNLLIAECFRGPAVYGNEMVNIFNNAIIVLNFLRIQNLEGHNMRTFEVLASGAFMLTQRTIDQTREPFHEEVNIVCFSTIEELIQKIRYYLEHSEQRVTIAQQGKILAQHYTLTKQLKNIFHHMQEGL